MSSKNTIFPCSSERVTAANRRDDANGALRAGRVDYLLSLLDPPVPLTGEARLEVAEEEAGDQPHHRDNGWPHLRLHDNKLFTPHSGLSLSYHKDDNTARLIAIYKAWAASTPTSSIP
jgi:hypothetical protein